MKLRRLEIENFRGIKSLELDLDDVNVLIGENNTGKTAVLDALRFALREVRTRRGCVFDMYDYHLPDAMSAPSSAAPIRLRLSFVEDKAGDWGDDRLGRLHREGILQLDADGRGCVVLEVMARYIENENDYAQDWQFLNLENLQLLSVRASALAVLQNEVGYFYLPALRDADRNFGDRGSFWRPFLKESRLTPNQKTEIEQKLAEINDLIIASHDSFDMVMTCLRDVCKVVPTLDRSGAVSIDAVPARVFDILARAQVNLSADTGAKVPVARHGEGMQSLAVLMLFNAFLRTWQERSAIIAIEEPEAHLHPSAVRALWQLIDQIPGQKIVSTHSGDLLAVAPSRAVIRLYHCNGRINSGRLACAGLDEKQTRQFNFHIRQARGELLFARCWILGEGETEVTLIPELARVRGLDLERSGIRCVAYRQADIDLYLNAAEALGINWIAICDDDRQGRQDQDKVRSACERTGRDPKNALFALQEANMDMHLCMAGFGSVYEGFLSAQTRAQITEEYGTCAYWEEVVKAVSKYKTNAIQRILEQIIAAEEPVPPFLESVITEAITLAEAP